MSEIVQLIHDIVSRMKSVLHTGETVPIVLGICRHSLSILCACGLRAFIVYNPDKLLERTRRQDDCSCPPGPKGNRGTPGLVGINGKRVERETEGHMGRGVKKES